jgi:DtxR family Mn-dependent transcriptional regulator
VRRHRLIETLLLQHLGYSWREVHEEAERLEHAVSDGFTERLAAFLGPPGQDPHGGPIPAADGTMRPDDSFPLGEATAGQRVRISKVSDDASMLDHLGERGLVPGRLLSVREVRGLDGVVTVDDEDGVTHALGEPLAHAVFVRTTQRDDARVAAESVPHQHGQVADRSRLVQGAPLGFEVVGDDGVAMPREGQGDATPDAAGHSRDDGYRFLRRQRHLP